MKIAVIDVCIVAGGLALAVAVGALLGKARSDTGTQDPVAVEYSTMQPGFDRDMQVFAAYLRTGEYGKAGRCLHAMGDWRSAQTDLQFAMACGLLQLEAARGKRVDDLLQDMTSEFSRMASEVAPREQLSKEIASPSETGETAEASLEELKKRLEDIDATLFQKTVNEGILLSLNDTLPGRNNQDRQAFCNWIMTELSDRPIARRAEQQLEYAMKSQSPEKPDTAE